MGYISSPDSGLHGVFPDCVNNDNGRLIAHRLSIASPPSQAHRIDAITTHLTDREVHAICGVYTDSTGQRNQTTYLSWWPLPSVWDACGLNVGYWSAGCENWFRTRLNSISSGQGRPYRSGQWKDFLRRGRNRINAMNSFLERDISPTVN